MGEQEQDSHPMCKYVHPAQRGTDGQNHRVHKVATTAFWRTFCDEGKIGPGC